MAITSLQELYLQKLQMIYDAEQQGQQALSRLVQAAHNGDLRSALQAHRQQTEEQVRRLEGLFRTRGESAERIESRSMRALIQEAEQVLPTIQDDDTRDAFLIAAQQAVEHHEIADYGTARTWARQLGFSEDASVLQAILDQERNADKLLSEVAERMVNPEAATAAGDVDVTGRAQAGDRGAAAARSSSAGGGRTTGDRGTTRDTEINPLNR
jgi:ferritin-like metal-binding protein YciE